VDADFQARFIFPLDGAEMSSVIGVRIRMADYVHDVALIDLRGQVGGQWLTGAPVQFIWGSATQAGQFVGYLDHVVTQPDGIQVVCVGASYLMKEPHQQIWTDVTVDQIALELADRYHFDADITPHPRVFAQIAQSGESDWQFLVRLAKSVGYSCYVHQTQLRFHPRSRDFVALQDEALVFTPTDFAPVIGDSMATEAGVARTARQMSALNAEGEIIGAVDSTGPATLAGSYAMTPMFGEVVQDIVDSSADAVATLDAQRELNRWYLTATANVRGNVRVRQDLPVYLAGLQAGQTGYWVVLEAEHQLAPQAKRYQLKLTLGRDGRGLSPDMPRGGRQIRAFGIDPLSGIADITESQLLNGQWVATRSSRTVLPEEVLPDFVVQRLADL
jgi:hypothetical protein